MGDERASVRLPYIAGCSRSSCRKFRTRHMSVMGYRKRSWRCLVLIHQILGRQGYRPGKSCSQNLTKGNQGNTVEINRGFRQYH